MTPARLITTGSECSISTAAKLSTAPSHGDADLAANISDSCTLSRGVSRKKSKHQKIPVKQEVSPGAPHQPAIHIPKTAGTVKTPETPPPELKGLVARGSVNNPTTLAIIDTDSVGDVSGGKEFLSELSDPALHNPDNFCYTVHAVNPFIGNPLKEEMKEKGLYRQDQDINLMDHPEKISRKEIIHCSVISQDHQDTWSRGMFILKFPFSSVISTFPRDTGGYHMTHRQPAETAPLMNPRKLVAATAPHEHNELRLSGKGVTIAAVAVKVLDVRGSLHYPLETEEFRALAEKLKVPFIELHEKSRLTDGPPVFSINECGTYLLDQCRDGWCYQFRYFPRDDRFTCAKTIGGHDGESITSSEYVRLRPDLAGTLKRTSEGRAMLARFDDVYGVSTREKAQ